MKRLHSWSLHLLGRRDKRNSLRSEVEWDLSSGLLVSHATALNFVQLNFIQLPQSQLAIA
jgi:hypothetical protein